jgi:hypothetical protein
MARDLAVGLTLYRDQQTTLMERYLEVYREFGYRGTVVVLSEGQEPLRQALQNDEVAFVISVTGQLARLGVSASDPVPYWDKAKIPFLAFYADGDFHHRAVADAMRSDYVRNCYAFPDLVTFQRDFGHDAVQSFGVTPGIPDNPLCDQTPWAARGILAALFKNLHLPLDIEASISHLPARFREIFWESVKVLTTDCFAGLRESVAAQFDAAGVSYARHKHELFYYMLKLVDLHVRIETSLKLGRALSRFPTLLVGQNWNMIDAPGNRATVLDRVPLDETYRLAAETKFFASTNTTLQNWFHERVVLGFKSKCNVISFDNHYYREHFARFPSLFRLTYADDLEDRLREIFQAPDDEASRHAAHAHACRTYDVRRHALELLDIARLDLAPVHAALQAGL